MWGCGIIFQDPCEFDRNYLEVRVVDASTGAPICDATVTAAIGNMSATSLSPSTQPTSSPDGAIDCSFRGGATPGTYTITVSRSGYATQTSTTDELRASQQCASVPSGGADQITFQLVKL
jgi:hypothetical protein